MKYLLVSVNSAIYTGYSLFRANTNEEAVLMLMEMTLTLNYEKSPDIEVCWDETKTMCTVKCEGSQLQGKLYEIDMASELCDILLDAFNISETDIDEKKKSEYQKIISLKEGIKNIRVVDLMLKKRWVYND